jgi:hypothetical protein
MLSQKLLFCESICYYASLYLNIRTYKNTINKINKQSVKFHRFRFLPHLRLYQITHPVMGNEAPTKEAKEAKTFVGIPPIVPTWISKLAR